MVLVGSAVGQLFGGSLPIITLQSALLGRAQSILLKKIPAGTVTATRDLTNSALSIMAAGGSVAQAQQLLTTAFAVQNMNVSSPTFASFPWQSRDLKELGQSPDLYPDRRRKMKENQL